MIKFVTFLFVGFIVMLNVVSGAFPDASNGTVLILSIMALIASGIILGCMYAGISSSSDTSGICEKSIDPMQSGRPAMSNPRFSRA